MNEMVWLPCQLLPAVPEANIHRALKCAFIVHASSFPVVSPVALWRGTVFISIFLGGVGEECEETERFAHQGPRANESEFRLRLPDCSYVCPNHAQ